MTFLQAAMIVIGVGFGLALINMIGTRNNNGASKPRVSDLAIPFLLKWVLYSGGVALALGVQYLLFRASSR